MSKKEQVTYLLGSVPIAIGALSAMCSLNRVQFYLSLLLAALGGIVIVVSSLLIFPNQPPPQTLPTRPSDDEI
jgi:hypothetical protein